MLNVFQATETGDVNPLLPAVYDIIWSAVCFAILLVVFFWKVLPRMQILLDQRSAAIEGNIAKADETQRKAEATLEQYTAQLAAARAEAGGIRESAREDGKRIIAEAKDLASVEATRVIASAQAQIQAERQAAYVSLRNEVGSLAIKLASGVLGESLVEDKKANASVNRFLSEIEQDSTLFAGKSK